jgi:putative DNA primase/helicase
MYQDFLNSLAKSGIPATHPLVFDGKLRRYNVAGDKKGRRNGWYRLVIVRPDFAWGVYGCNKRGISEKYNSIEGGKLTNYDKKAMRQQQAAIKKDEEVLQARVAEKANQIWNRLRAPASHLYAERKQIKLYNAREMNGSLVVPVYEDNHIVSLQFITAQGEKRFLSHGKVRGCYGIIASDVTPRIWLCEGWATGATIFEAVGEMVIVAFFANNLVPVAEAIRAKYPDAQIVIGADNDSKTSGNPGISYAREAAEKVGARVVYPDFPATDNQTGTDWNDWRILHGLEDTKQELLGTKKPAQQVAIADENLWKTKLIDGSQFLPGYKLFDPKSKKNVYAFMANHERYKGLVAYNAFTNKITIMKQPPWDNKQDNNTPRDECESDAPMWAADLESFGIKTSKDVVGDFIKHIAEANTINPPADYFNSLVWDGQKRLDTWLTYYLGAEKQDREYLRLVGSKWLMAVVARALTPGVKFDNVLILEGAQGIKKTAAFEVLATFNDENFFLEFSGDVTKKDSLEMMQGKIIVEMAELASVRKSEVEEMKAFVSRRVDEYRPSYGRKTIKRPRYFILGGSTNKVGQEYLEDDTGARRIWPVECGDSIDLDALRRHQSQLYAEAMTRYKNGERIWLEGEEVALAKSEQSSRQAQDVWEEKISSYVKEALRYEFTVSEVGIGIGLMAKDLNNYNTGRIKKCLRSIGWEEYRPGEGDGRMRKWRKK